MVNIYEVFVDVVNCLGIFTIRYVVAAESELFAVQYVKHTCGLKGEYIAVYVTRSIVNGIAI